EKTCAGWQCIHADYCNGLSNRYICLPIDSRFIPWILFGSIIVVLSCCSTLIVCYACWLLQVRVRHPIAANYKVTFQNRIPSPFRTSVYV
ncbi:unnamed protein product, partial [Litomosoides sigmodontis]